MAEDALMTTKEVADMYQVEPRTVARWVQFGILRCVRIKRRGFLGRATVRFRRVDVLALREQTVAGGGPGLARRDGGGAGGRDASKG